MPIRVTCTNPDCGRPLAFREQFAGKKTRCPGCQTIITIPHPGSEPLPPAPKPPKREVPEPEPAPPSRDALQRAPTSPRESLARDEFDDDTPRRRRSESRGRSRDRDDDVEEDDDLDEDEWDRPIVPAHKGPSTIVLTYLCAALLGVMAATTLFPWVTQTWEVETVAEFRVEIDAMGSMKVNGEYENEEKIDASEKLDKDQRPNGLFFMIACASVAGVIAVGFTFALLNVTGPRVASAVTLLGAAFSILALVWTLGWLWKQAVLSSVVNEEFSGEKRSGFNAHATPFPGMGLLVAIGISLATAYLFSFLGGRYVKKHWVYLFEGIGLLLGVAIVLLLLVPWEAEDLWLSMNEILRPVIFQPKIEPMVRPVPLGR